MCNIWIKYKKMTKVSLFTRLVNNIVFHYISGSIKKLSYKGQALTLEFATKMITHLQEAKQQQVELVTIAIDTDLVLQGSASNSQIGRKAVC